MNRANTLMDMDNGLAVTRGDGEERMGEKNKMAINIK